MGVFGLLLCPPHFVGRECSHALSSIFTHEPAQSSLAIWLDFAPVKSAFGPLMQIL